MSHSPLNDDCMDVLRALDEGAAEFLVVGAHAMAVHGVPRATGDLDIWIRPTPDNVERVLRALESFGAPFRDHGLGVEDLQTAGTEYQVGLPPRRIDLLTSVTPPATTRPQPESVEDVDQRRRRSSSASR